MEIENESMQKTSVHDINVNTCTPKTDGFMYVFESIWFLQLEEDMFELRIFSHGLFKERNKDTDQVSLTILSQMKLSPQPQYMTRMLIAQGGLYQQGSGLPLISLYALFGVSYLWIYGFVLGSVSGFYLNKQYNSSLNRTWSVLWLPTSTFLLTLFSFQ